MSSDERLALEQAGTEAAYFTHDGEPLLSFGGLSDFAFFGDRDIYDWKHWADWAADHGMNHVRAYLPLGWLAVEEFVEQSGATPPRLYSRTRKSEIENTI